MLYNKPRPDISITSHLATYKSTMVLHPSGDGFSHPGGVLPLPSTLLSLPTLLLLLLLLSSAPPPLSDASFPLLPSSESNLVDHFEQNSWLKSGILFFLTWLNIVHLGFDSTQKLWNLKLRGEYIPFLSTHPFLRPWVTVIGMCLFRNSHFNILTTERLVMNIMIAKMNIMIGKWQISWSQSNEYHDCKVMNIIIAK